MKTAVLFSCPERLFRPLLRHHGVRVNANVGGSGYVSRRQFLHGAAVIGLSSAAALIVDGCTSPASTPKLPRIGVLSLASDPAVLEPFRQGLHELGYVPDENITIVYRYTMGNPDPDLIRALAAELVGLNLDVIVTAGQPSAAAAKNATTAIPIVAVILGADPVGNGLVANLARPGGNLTGFTYGALGSTGKRLELLKQAIPKARRVAGLGLPSYYTNASGSWWKLNQDAAETLGIELVAVITSGADDFERAFDTAIAERADALVTAPDATLFTNHVRIAKLALQKSMPAVFDDREYVDAGGLMNYGPNLADTFRRAAGYVDRILKGAKPADLPVQQPSKFDLVINLKTAAALGLTIPPSVLAQATELR
jgi:putative tryptophan/tyrosine transport system substrate-binding protein